ncbi:hypothetical protein ACU5AY_09025 [Rhizobium sp. PAMB 3174]
MVPISGTTVPQGDRTLQKLYAKTISQALQQELGQSARATKTIMKWTGASERAARYWLQGSRAPGGWQLVLLVKNSDVVLREILRMSGRDLHELSLELDIAEISLNRAAAMVHALRAATH